MKTPNSIEKDAKDLDHAKGSPTPEDRTAAGPPRELTDAEFAAVAGGGIRTSGGGPGGSKNV